MSSRALVALGTASQVPTRYRNHNGYYLRWDDEGLLFDPGEGTQRQMTFAGVSSAQIHRVFVTHFHGDHALGLAGLFQRISLDAVAHTVHVYYPASGQVFLDRLRYSTIYLDRARVELHPIQHDGVVAETDRFTLRASRLDHGVDCFGYALHERDGRTMLPARLEAEGVRGPQIRALTTAGSVNVDGRTVRLEDVSVLRRGQRFAFVMDTRPCPAAVELAQNADLLVCESTYLESEASEADAHRHMTARQAGLLAAAAGARRLVLTHFSQRYADSTAFAEQAGAVFGDVVAATDLLTVPVPPRLASNLML